MCRFGTLLDLSQLVLPKGILALVASPLLTKILALRPTKFRRLSY